MNLDSGNYFIRESFLKILFAISFTFIIVPCFSQEKKFDRLYTNEAIDNKIEGVIYIQFSVNEKGLIKESIKISKGLGYGLDELALEAMKSSPNNWQPPSKEMLEKYGGTVKFTLPVRLSLSQIKDKEWAIYYTEKGYNLIKQNQPDDAIVLFQKSLEKQTRNPNALYGIYQAYEIKGDTTNAKIYLTKAYKKGYR